VQTATRATNKQEQQQHANNKLVNKHQEVQVQLQDLNFAKLNQTTINNIHQTNEQASTNEPIMPLKNNIAHIHCRQH
jgi:hypothetical protein